MARRRRLGVEWGQPILPQAPWGGVRSYVEDYSTLSGSQLARLPTQCSRVWLISRNEDRVGGPPATRADFKRFRRLQAGLRANYPGERQLNFGYGRSVVALKEFPRQELSAYGCVRSEQVDETLVRVLDLVEKPTAEEAPSNLAVMGRYVFTPEIFAALERVQPGRGGEIQLTDAMALLLREQTIYGYVFEHGRYDVGDKFDYLRATVEMAIDREDLGPQLRAFLVDLVQRKNLL